MKKFTILCFLTLIMCSCNYQPTPQYETVVVDLPIETFVKDFLDENPNLFNNDITLKEGSTRFIDSLADTLKTTNGRMFLFDNVPLRLQTINKNKKLGYVAQFNSWITPINFDFHYVGEIGFDVFCVIPDSLAYTLKENKHYILDGTYVNHLTYNQSCNILGKTTSVWNSKIDIKKNTAYSSDYYQRQFNLGCFLMLFENIKEYECRETKTIRVN